MRVEEDRCAGAEIKKRKISREGVFMAGAMRVVKPLITGMKLERKRSGHNLLGKIRGVPKTLKSFPAEDCPLDAEWILPACPAPLPSDTVFLFIHGGSYLTGSLIGSRPVAGLLCEVSGVRTITFAYRLAPEHPYPAALEDALKMWEYLLIQGISPQHILLVGESAGGGLAMALTMLLRDKGRDLPGGIVGISAWADLTETSGSHIRCEKIDPIINSDELRAAAVKYSAGESLKNPYISPVYGDFRGFPPTLLHVGSREVLLDDTESLYLKLREAGAPVRLSVYEGMWHVWHGFDIPESRDAMQEIRQFAYDITKG